MRTALPRLALCSLLLAACGGEASRTGDAKGSDAKKADAKTTADTKTPTDAKVAEAKPEAQAGDTKAGDTKPADAKAEPTAPGQTRFWSFDEDAVGKVPAGIRPTEAGGTGTPATWAVVAPPSPPSTPSPPHAFGITESKNTKKTYNLALFEGTSYGDVDIQVWVKAGTGELNQGGGIIWRVKDVDNYYIARWDPIEDNAYLYIVQGGVRTALAKLDVELDPELWHSLRVVAEGSRIELFIDDEPKLTAENAELKEPGMIGLWTKSDAATLFDDLSIAAP